MTAQFYEEEEFTTQFNGKTVLRILAQTQQHWLWVVAFIISIIITSILDGYFTYLGKQIIDLGILAGDRQALVAIVTRYAALILVQAVTVLGFVYLAGVLGERVRGVALGTRQVLFAVSAGDGASLSEAAFPIAPGIEHTLVTGLLPGASYRVTLEGSATRTLTADAGGMLLLANVLPGQVRLALE